MDTNPPTVRTTGPFWKRRVVPFTLEETRRASIYQTRVELEEHALLVEYHKAMCRMLEKRLERLLTSVAVVKGQSQFPAIHTAEIPSIHTAEDFRIPMPTYSLPRRT